MSNIATRTANVKLKRPKAPHINWPDWVKEYGKIVRNIFVVGLICVGALVLWCLPVAIFIWGLVEWLGFPTHRWGGWLTLGSIVLAIFWYPLATIITRRFEVEL